MYTFQCFLLDVIDSALLLPQKGGKQRFMWKRCLCTVKALRKTYGQFALVLPCSAH